MNHVYQAPTDGHKTLIAKVEKVLSFVRGLLARYDFSKDEKRQIEAETGTIERRVRDNTLYLGIVGEFSTGKSTFINALLGFELLKEDVLQGTTCAPTILRAGEEFRMTVSFSDGRPAKRYPGQWSFWVPKWKVGDGNTSRMKCLTKASAFLEEHTADESIAKGVSLVTIEIPSDVWCLPPDIAIVDTPGTNSGNIRHTEVARQAVHAHCDLCAALTSATEPCPRTLVAFIEESLADMQKRCIGIVTQIDKLRPRERARVVQYVDDRLQSEGIEFQKVFGAAPLLVVHPEESAGKPDAETLRADFKALVAELSERLRKGRNEAIDEKLAALVHRLIDSILPLFKNLRDELQTRAENLETNKLANPRAFFAEAKQVANEDLERSLEDAFLKSASALRGFIEETKTKDATALTEADSISAVKKILGRKYSSELKEPLRRWLQICSEASAREAENSLSRFHQRFNVSFRNLSRRAVGSIDIDPPNVKTRPPKIDLEEVMKAIRAIDREDSLKRLGGGLGAGGAGALVGSLFGGPVGAAVGAGIGALAGLILNGKNIEEVKTSARTLLDTKFQTLEETIRGTIRQEAGAAVGAIRGEVHGTIDRYEKKYTKEITALIEAERRELQGLKYKRSKVESDLNRLYAFQQPTPEPHQQPGRQP